MRIFRYPLEIVDYQQLQPVWPGRILAVGAHMYDDNGLEIPLDSPERGIDLWATAADPHDRNVARDNGLRTLAPVLGVWIVGTGNVFPDGIRNHDALFHGTVDMRPHLGVWHVWTAVVGHEPETPQPLGEVDSIGGLVEKMKTRHADRGAGA